jgi:quinol monooxygenase YgiN
MADALTVVARIRAANGRGDALAAFLTEQAATVKAAEPDCLAYRVHRSTSDPLLFLFYETYASVAAYEAHRKAPHLAAFRKRREELGLLDGQVEVEVFRPITE